MFSSASSPRSSAKVVDGNLIISLPDAKDPVVWRMALGEARAAAIEVQTRGDDHFVLVLKYPKGDPVDIAPFSTKHAATSALMAVSHAMQAAHGQISAQRQVAANDFAASGMAARRKTGAWKWLLPLGVIVLALFIFARTGTQLPVEAVSQQSGDATPVSPQNGVPQSADSFLNGM